MNFLVIANSQYFDYLLQSKCQNTPAWLEYLSLVFCNKLIFTSFLNSSQLLTLKYLILLETPILHL